MFLQCLSPTVHQPEICGLTNQEITCSQEQKNGTERIKFDKQYSFSNVKKSELLFFKLPKVLIQTTQLHKGALGVAIR